jgi:hypothetical protein
MNLKFKISIILLLSLVIALVSCISKSKKEEADKYIFEIADAKTPVVDSINSIIYSCRSIIINFTTEVPNDIELVEFNTKVDNCLLQINSSIEVLNSMDEFDNKIQLKATLLNYLKELKELLDGDFRLIFNSCTGEFSEEKSVKITDVYLRFSLRLIELDRSMEDVERKFVEKYSLQVIFPNQNWDQMEKDRKEQIKQNELRKEALKS